MQVVKERYARHLLHKKRRKPGARRVVARARAARVAAPLLRLQCWGERKRVEKLRYMHRRPVKRGLVLEAEQWAWSSYRSYAFGEDGIVKINQWPRAVMKIRSVA